MFNLVYLAFGTIGLLQLTHFMGLPFVGLFDWFGGLEKNVVHFVHHDFGNAVALGGVNLD